MLALSRCGRGDQGAGLLTGLTPGDAAAFEAGNRVLIRSANNPAMVAACLGATKAGAVVVNTMPMLRAGELAKMAAQGQRQPQAQPGPPARRCWRSAPSGRSGAVRTGSTSKRTWSVPPGRCGLPAPAC